MTQHTGHSVFVRPEEERFITGDVMKQLSLVGPADQLIKDC